MLSIFRKFLCPAERYQISFTNDSSVLVQLKRWERKECKPNSLPKLHKMHVKIGDTVKIISGREKGKIGEITEIMKHNSTIIVKDINLKTKHVKSKQEEESGQIIKVLQKNFFNTIFHRHVISFFYSLYAHSSLKTHKFFLKMTSVLSCDHLRLKHPSTAQT